MSRRNGDGYIGNVIKGSISQRDTLGCLSPAVDSSQPTCIKTTLPSGSQHIDIFYKPRSPRKFVNPKKKKTYLDRAPMRVWPTRRIQITDASYCAHIAEMQHKYQITELKTCLPFRTLQRSILYSRKDSSIYRRTLDSSVSNSILKRIPTEIRV